jgi:dipeptidyl aminopeptidase/acylaminoacyl peptidase
MFDNLDDPTPPIPSDAVRERVVAEGRRRRRHRQRLVLAAAAAVVLITTAGVAVALQGDDPQRVDIIGESTTTAPSPGNPTTTSVPGAASATQFAAITTRGDIVMVDSATGQVVTTLAHLSDLGVECCYYGDVALAPDGSVFFSASRPDATSSIWRVQTAGGAPAEVARGHVVAVSPDGRSVAFGMSYPPAVVVEPLGGGGTPLAWSPNEDEFVEEIRGLSWTDDGRSVLVETGAPEAPSSVYAVDVSTGDGRRLGPDPTAPDGTGWYSPDGRATDGLVSVVEACCSLDANSYDGGRRLLALDPATGEIVDDLPLDRPFDAVAHDASGTRQLALAFEEGGNVLYRRVGDGFEPIDSAEEFTAIDW